MRSPYQIALTHTSVAERNAALDFVLRCIQRGPQVAYEPSPNWHAAQLALGKGWVYVAMMNTDHGDPDRTRTEHYVSNLTAKDVASLRAPGAASAP